ncbi:cytochrome P450 [Mycena capillaripes]|nr:cytochrome P450 [Mycena capillaripes]
MAAEPVKLSPATLVGAMLAAFVVLQYPGKAFKVALGNRWLVILNGRTLVEEFQKAPDDCLSQSESLNLLLHFEHTVGYEQHHNPFQVPVVRTHLTRNLGAVFPIIQSEVVAAFEEFVPATADKWITVPAMQTFLLVVSRVANRYFIGLKCRDPDYIKITTQFALDVTADAVFLHHAVPSILRPYVMSTTCCTMEHLGPMLQYCLEMDNKYGPDWPNGDRPNDVISWLLNEARGHPERHTVRTLTRTLLNLNFGAIHTTTQTFLHALYNFASNLQYVEPLRKEIKAVVKLEGWSKAAVGKMIKLDSFLKESARFVPGGAVLKDYTFSDGSIVPAGTFVGVPILAQQHDEASYVNAGMFDPFRFSRMREEAGEGIKHQMFTPNLDFLFFGLGCHACPGRFFAVNELKLLMTHLLITYDFKLKDGVQPKDE